MLLPGIRIGVRWPACINGPFPKGFVRFALHPVHRLVERLGNMKVVESVLMGPRGEIVGHRPDEGRPHGHGGLVVDGMMPSMALQLSPSR